MIRSPAPAANSGYQAHQAQGETGRHEYPVENARPVLDGAVESQRLAAEDGCDSCREQNDGREEKNVPSALHLQFNLISDPRTLTIAPVWIVTPCGPIWIIEPPADNVIIEPDWIVMGAPAVMS